MVLMFYEISLVHVVSYYPSEPSSGENGVVGPAMKYRYVQVCAECVNLKDRQSTHLVGL
jgi:hypothetical protein